MRPTQMQLEKWIKWSMVAIGIVLMLTLRSFGNLVLTIFFGLFIIAFPFWLDSLVRFKFIPYLDSLSNDEVNDEEFSIGFRVWIWSFIGITMSAIWTVIVPLIFMLPLWIGRIAHGLFGVESMRLGVWQYGWMIIFLLQYLIDFYVGFMLRDDEGELSDRFEYPIT